MFTVSFLLTIYAGFTHAFEADHLLAVSSLVSQRNSIRVSIKEGFFWGLGHASAILLTGFFIIILRTAVSLHYFKYFEAAVGLMLIVLAVFRLIKFYTANKNVATNSIRHWGERDQHSQLAIDSEKKYLHPHLPAYGIGLLHGLAGSGALIIVVMSRIKTPAEGLVYLLVFGAACIGGMVLAAGLFSIPFSKKNIYLLLLQHFLIIISALMCLFYGGKVIYESLIK